MGRLKVIFCLPKKVNQDGIGGSAPVQWPTVPLAYVTWYTRFKASPDDQNSGMYRVEPAKYSNGMAQGAIIPLTDIRQTCMLTPARSTWDTTWSTENILDKCNSFLVNNLQSKYSYQTVY